MEIIMNAEVGRLVEQLWQLPQAGTGVGDFVFFELIANYLDGKISLLADAVMRRAMAWVGLTALSLLTIWIMVVGYQIVTGTYRDSLSSLVTDMAKKVLIVSVAVSMSLFGTNLQHFFTVDVDQAVNQLVNGEETKSTADSIDESLAYMQVAFTAIDSVQVLGDDADLRGQKERALLFAGFGTSSPAMTAGAMLIFFKFIIGFFVGLGPLFILMLLFKKTQPMFQRWLQYGIATLFAMAGLNAVTAIVLELSTRVAIAFWGAKAINGLLAVDPEGLSMQAMQQGGIGLLLSVAIVSVPSALAAFFGGVAGNFMAFSQFPGGGSGSGLGPQGQMPGSYSPLPAANQPTGRAAGEASDSPREARAMGPSGLPQPDGIKQRNA
jgi:type IV secretion system protein VirB6